MPVAATAGHRRRLLRALGVTPYALRTATPAAVSPGAAPAVGPAAGTVSGARCVLVLPHDCGQQVLAVLERALASFGALLQPSACIMVADDGQVAGDIPAAPAYLVLGERQAHALGRSLPADVMAGAEVVLLDLPQALLQAGGKRRLWQALCGLRRGWRR